MTPLSNMLPPAPEVAPIPAELLPYYEEGKAAGAAEQPLDSCRYRRQDRRAAWMRGWHDGQRAAEPAPAFTPEEKARGLEGVAAARAALGPVLAEGWKQVARWHYFRKAGQALCGVFPYVRGSYLAAPLDGANICEICRERAP